LRSFWAASQGFSKRWLRATSSASAKETVRQAGLGSRDVPPAASWVWSRSPLGPAAASCATPSRQHHRAQPPSTSIEAPGPMGPGTQPGRNLGGKNGRTHVGSEHQNGLARKRLGRLVRGWPSATGSPSRAQGHLSSLPTWARCQQRPQAWPCGLGGVGQEKPTSSSQRFRHRQGGFEAAAAGLAFPAAVWGRAGRRGAGTEDDRHPHGNRFHRGVRPDRWGSAGCGRPWKPFIVAEAVILAPNPRRPRSPASHAGLAARQQSSWKPTRTGSGSSPAAVHQPDDNRRMAAADRDKGRPLKQR